MKKLINPLPGGGAPLFTEDLNELLQVDIWDALQGILSSFDGDSEGVIVSGGVVTSASAFNITAGIAYLDGEFYRFPATTGITSGDVIKPKAVQTIQRVYQDSISRDLIEFKEAEVATGTVAGQEIVISSLTPRRWNSKPFNGLTSTDTIRTLSAAQGKVLKDLVDSIDNKFGGLEFITFDIGDWNMDITGSVILNVPGFSIADYKRIRSVSVIIRDDNDSGYRDIGEIRKILSPDPTPSGNVGLIDTGTGDITINRVNGGAFDNTSHDSTSYNRGWVTISYI